MIDLNQIPLASDATEPAVTGSLLDDVREIPATPENYTRIEKDRSYRGVPRTECSDFSWNAVLYAGKILASRIDPLDQYSDLPDLVGQALFSLQATRPAKQLFIDILSAAGIDDGDAWGEWWDQRTVRKPADDFHSLLILANCYSWPAMQNRPPAQPVPMSRFAPRVPDLNSPRPKWRVKNLVPDQGQAMIYGRHGTGKSTLAIEMGVAVALGQPWHGRKTLQGTVVYIASEDAHGFRARLDALLRDRGITLDDLEGRFLELTSRPHLLKPEEVTELIKELKPLNPAAIFVDTMARAAAGADENSAQEMGVMIENCQTIINQTGATVVLLHHTGKDASKGARGSSAIPGAVDAEIFLERPDETENLRIAHVGKMRGAQDYYTLFRYSLETVQLGVDDDGDKITSTVVREMAPDPVGVRPAIKLKNSPVRIAIRSVLSDAQPVTFEEMITSAKEKLSPPDPGEEDRRRDRIKSTFERMIGDRELHMDANGMVSLLDPTMPFTPVQADVNADLIGSAT